MRTPTLLDCCRKKSKEIKPLTKGCTIVAQDGLRYKVKQIKGETVKACLETFDNPLYTFSIDKIRII